MGVVFCNGPAGEKLATSIAMSYHRASAQAAGPPVGLGHRRAAIIAGPDDNRTAITIKDALFAGLKERDLTPVPVITSNYRIDSGASALRAILSPPSTPTPIFSVSSLIALCAMTTHQV